MPSGFSLSTSYVDVVGDDKITSKISKEHHEEEVVGGGQHGGQEDQSSERTICAPSTMTNMGKSSGKAFLGKSTVAGCSLVPFVPFENAPRGESSSGRGRSGASGGYVG